jgi:hypothetical protein
VWRSRIRPILARSRTAKALRSRLIGAWARWNPANRVRPYDQMRAAQAVTLAYQMMLRREPDPVGFEDYVTGITTGL